MNRQSLIKALTLKIITLPKENCSILREKNHEHLSIASKPFHKKQMKSVLTKPNLVILRWHNIGTSKVLLGSWQENLQINLSEDFQKRYFSSKGWKSMRLKSKWCRCRAVRTILLKMLGFLFKHQTFIAHSIVSLFWSPFRGLIWRCVVKNVAVRLRNAMLFQSTFGNFTSIFSENESIFLSSLAWIAWRFSTKSTWYRNQTRRIKFSTVGRNFNTEFLC